MSHRKLLVGAVFAILMTLNGCQSTQNEKPDEVVDQKPQQPVYCTQDAKLCPDGSYVGRQGPKCEFDPCPEKNNEQSEIVGWKTYVDEKVQFQYPEDFGSEFAVPYTWPPKVTINEGIFSCATEVHLVENRAYCVSTQKDGSAGNVYTTYNYLSNHESENIMISVEFTVRFPQCGNYSDPQRTLCENSQKNLDLDGLVDKISQTAQ